MHLSYWEKQTYFNDLDLVIVGGGIVGLNVARCIREYFPKWKILVTDRGFLPYGASTRNAGFACYGSISELIDDLTKMNEAELISLIRRRWNGLLKLRNVLGDDLLHYEELGGYEVFNDRDDELYTTCISQINYFNDILESITEERNIYSNADHLKTSLGLNKTSHLILNRREGQLNPGSMMDALMKLVRSKNIDIITGLDIASIDQLEDDRIHLQTNNDFYINTKRVLITTNGFAKQLLPELNIEPGRAQVLITSPIQDLKLKGSFHFDKGYYYFRNIDNRILFGGGRNLNFDQERTTEFGLTDLIQNQLKEYLSEFIIPDVNYSIDQQWSGIMGLGPVKVPIIQEVKPNIFCAVRMGGMGIAIGTLVAEEVADLIKKSVD